MQNSLVSSLIDIGGLVALFGVPFLVWNARTKRKHFDFDFEGSSGTADKSGNKYTWTFSGVIKNRSEIPNTISKIFLVVWKNKKRNSYLRFGHDSIKVLEINNSNELKIPLYFNPREAKKVEISRTATITETSDSDYKILVQKVKISPDSDFFLPKYNYELVFEDIDKNYFDQHGSIRDINEANLWFTLGNSYRQLDDLKFLPIINHFLNIALQKIKFAFKRLFWFLGLV